MTERTPLAADFVPGKRMYHGAEKVVYIGKSSSGAFVCERPMTRVDGVPAFEFVRLWPFQLRVRDLTK